MEETKKEAVWVIDPVHTRIRFDTKYLLLTPVSGWFTQFEGSVITPEENFNGSQVQLTIYTNSVYTGNEERDAHLRSPDFFDVRKYPVITYKSGSVTVQGNQIQATGILSIKDTVQEITWHATQVGTSLDAMGNTKAGFMLDATFNRKDFNITWNQFIDKHGLLLSDEVTLHCDVQLLRLP
ncbi:YceI family protein [Pseudoflavitalea sp. X16]|uniref:YceI family protein n=1 Tax=Paraflavitalea devenefica TaxID=2716334 RepID=UPI0014218135|nr:YceI family protein [Paraflavitalea devenefica]NII23807.1 YceI family protein [Paraflavitalea devenefica]